MMMKTKKLARKLRGAALAAAVALMGGCTLQLRSVRTDLRHCTVRADGAQDLLSPAMAADHTGGEESPATTPTVSPTTTVGRPGSSGSALLDAIGAAVGTSSNSSTAPSAECAGGGCSAN